MSKGWHLVARLGGTAARYPHVLVDAHGWCLRFGPVPRDDDKFFSRLETLLEGLVEHCTRRRLARLGTVLDPRGLLGEVRDALASARDLAKTAVQETAYQTSIRPLDALPPLREACGSFPRLPARPTALVALSPKPA